MFELNSHQVLTELYDNLLKMGERKREIEGQSYRLAEWSLDDRLDVCVYFYNGVINELDGMNCVFTFGETEYRWSHLAGVREAVMFAKVNWKDLLDFKKQVRSMHPLYNLPENETIDGLTDDQVFWIMHRSLRKDHLIRSWEGVDIREGFDVHKAEYITKPIPKKFVVERKPSRSITDRLLRKTEVSVPQKYQEIRYKNDVVKFLVDYVNHALSHGDF